MIRVILILACIAWFGMVFWFSDQNGTESEKVSTKVTRELLEIKDTLKIVMENYEDTNEIVIKRNSN